MKFIKRIIRPFKKNKREVQIVSSAIQSHNDNMQARQIFIKYIKANN